MLFWIASKIAALIIAWVATFPAPQPVVKEPIWTPPLVTATSIPTTVPSALPTPVTTQTNYQYQSNNTALDQWIAGSNWPPQYWNTVRRIVLCESGGVVGIRNGPHKGLMQANTNFWGYVPDEPIAELNQGYYIFTQ